MRLAVIVPTYRRPRDLERCLAALEAQQRPADQLIVVARADDHATQAVVQAVERLPLQVATVHVTGVVAALNEGLRAVDADVVAFTDDDAAPRPDWLEKVAAHFAADPRLGGLGGRDWVHHAAGLEDGTRPIVGKLSWFGRCVGDHHLGVGPPREVDVLKGVNMSFRSAALIGVRFDTRLRGTGAQVCNELGVSLEVKRRGWRLLYDPNVAVDHYPSIRHDEDQRNAFSAEAVRNAVFNETLLLCDHFAPARKLVFIVWALTVGHRAAPGLLQWLRLLIKELDTATARFGATLSGRIHGWMASR